MHKGAAEKIFEKEVVRESNGDRFIAYIKRKWTEIIGRFQNGPVIWQKGCSYECNWDGV